MTGPTIVVPTREGIPDPSPIGGEGEYTVMITLRHPSTSIFGTALSHHPNGIMGDSLLGLPQALEITAGVGPEGQQSFQLLPNRAGRLGMVKFKVHATHINAAEMRAMDIAQPFLSMLAVTQNVPLTVHAVTTVEARTGVISLSAGLAGREKRMNFGAGVHLPVLADSDLAKVFSAYREALNAQDPFQKIISLWRVYEGLLRVRKTVLDSLPAEQRKTFFPRNKLPASVEDIPNRYRDGAADSMFGRVLGQSHQKGVEAFTDDYRHAVAHLNLADRDGAPRPVRTADTWSDVMSCWNAAQVLEYVLRDYLKATLSVHPQYAALPFD